MQQIILVNKSDEPRGKIGKLEAHLGKGKRHRAFTVFLRNSKGEILMTQRPLTKPLWPTFWDGSFSSHPWAGENLEVACERRAKEELGIRVTGFKELFDYEYHLRWNEWFSEWEINHVLLASYDDNLKPNPNEISDWEWINWDKILTIKKQGLLVPWISLIIKRLKIIFQLKEI